MTVYYKMRQMLLQNATAILLQNATEVYYKMRQVFYYKMRQFYYKMRQLLQNATFITNCNSTHGLTSVPASCISIKLYPIVVIIETELLEKKL